MRNLEIVILLRRSNSSPPKTDKQQNKPASNHTKNRIETNETNKLVPFLVPTCCPSFPVEVSGGKHEYIHFRLSGMMMMAPGEEHPDDGLLRKVLVASRQPLGKKPLGKPRQALLFVVTSNAFGFFCHF